MNILVKSFVWMAVFFSCGCLLGQGARPSAPKFEIQRAVYEAVDGAGGADVTEKVKSLVKDGRLSATANNTTLGGDTAPGRRKRLRVEYTLDGKPHVVTVNENDKLDIPPLPPLSPEERRVKALAALKSDAPLYEKFSACRELSVLGGKESVPVLAGLLADAELSHMARYALEPMPDPAAGEALREALGRVKGLLLVGVINSIGVRRDAQAVGALTGLLKDPDRAVGSAAAAALGKIGTPDAARAVEQALGDAPDQLRPALHEAWLCCADALAAQGRRDEALAIYDRLRGSQASGLIRAAAVRGSILSRGAAGAPLLVEQLHSADPLCFAMALRVALELPGAEVTQSLAAELAKLPADKQPLLAQVLGKRGDAAALPALLAAARSKDKNVRLAGILALPEIGDPSAASVLVEAVTDPDEDIAKAALDSLGGLPGKETDAAVVAMLGNPNAKRRLIAVELVGRRRIMSAIPNVLKAADDADPPVRAEAMKTLGLLCGEAETPILLDRLMSARESQDRDATEKALSVIFARAENPDACAQMLVERMAQAQAQQKPALLRLLTALGGPKALEAVRGAVGDSDAEVHASAVRALGKWRTAEAGDALLKLAKSSSNVADKLLCLRSYIGLAGNSQLSDAQRIAICKQAEALIERDDERRLLLGTLGGVLSAEALAAVMPYMDNPALKDEAAAAAVAICEKLKGGKDKVIAAMQKALKSAQNKSILDRARKVLDRAEGRTR